MVAQYDGITEALFKKDAAGKTVYYPWGTRRTGVIIPSEDEVEFIKKKANKFYKWLPYIVLIPVFSIAVFGISLINIIIFFSLIIIYFLTFEIIIRKLIKKYQKSDERYTFYQIWSRDAEVTTFRKIIFYIALFIFMLAYGMHKAIIEGSLIYGIIAIIVFGFPIFVSCFMIYVKFVRK